MVPKLKGKHRITTTASNDDWIHELFPKEAQHQVLHSKVRNGDSQILKDNVPEPAAEESRAQIYSVCEILQVIWKIRLSS